MLQPKHPYFFLFLLGLLYLSPAAAQRPDVPNKEIDALITGLPAMMRSHEDSARLMITLLETRSQQQGHHHGGIQAVFYKAWVSYRHDPPEKAIAIIDSALQHIPGITADTSLVKFYILKGQCYVKKTQFARALENFDHAMRIARKRKDMTSVTSTLVSIGWAYMEDGKPNEAIRFFNEVLQLNPSPEYPFRAVLLNNIAASYNTLGDFKRAEVFARNGIRTARSTGNRTDLANGLNILARSYYQQGKMATAIAFLKEGAETREKIADPSMLASDYLELADLYHKNDQPAEALAWAKKAEAISEKNGNSLKLAAAYRSLATAYQHTGDHRNASFYLEKLLTHKDSLADDHYNKAFAEMQVQYESQKKTTENLQLKKENLETKLRNSNQQRWLFSLVAGLILLIASGFYISKLMKSRYRTRLALEQLKEQKKRTIAVMEAEETERRRIAGDLHDGLGQTLIAASMQLNKAMKEQLPLDKVDELIHQASEEARSLSHQVTPELLLRFGLEKAMEQAVDRLNDANDTMVFSLFTHIETPIQDQMVSLTLYRCFQELCTNIIKHASATEITVQLHSGPEGIQLMVEDNGTGFAPSPENFGLGLKNMESRLAIFDGSLLVDSTPGKGTTCILKIDRSAMQPNKKNIADA